MADTKLHVGETIMQRVNSFTSLTVLIAASIVSAVLGSIHAFSVFLEPLEIQFSEPRPAASFILFVCILAACGVLVAGLADSLPIVWLGYSLIFGVANRLGYGFGLQFGLGLPMAAPLRFVPPPSSTYSGCS